MKQFLYIIIGLVTAGLSTSAYADTLTQNQELTFGEGVIKDNSAQYEIVVDTDGSYTNDPEIALISFPQEGIYTFDGLQSQPITVIVTVQQQLIGTGLDFVIDNITVDAPATTDPSGTATIRVGARMQTTGDGFSYNNSNSYSGLINVDVSY